MIETIKNNFDFTYDQFGTILSGKADNNKSNASKRFQSSLCFAGRFIVLPIDVPLRMLFNSTLVMTNAAHTCYRGLRMIVRKDNAKMDLKIASVQLFDSLLVAALSPAQAPLKLTCLFLGVIYPPLLYRQPYSEDKPKGFIDRVGRGIVYIL